MKKLFKGHLPPGKRTSTPDEPTKILFYLEPLIFICQPLLYQGWIPLWARLVETLDKNPDHKFSYMLITSEPLASIVSNYHLPAHVQVIPISQEKVIAPFNFLAMDAGIAWYKETYSDEQMKYISRLFEKELNGWQPDIIISSSQVPFLKKIFPDAAAFYFEVGMTSRPPFPMSYYLDPLGLYKHSFLAKRCVEIKQQPMGLEDTRLLAKYRDTFLPLIRAKNPFSDFIRSYQNKFKYIILLPLQVEGCWGNGNCDFITNFQFVHKVMSTIDPEIGVIVTLHPSDKWMTKDNEQYFRNKFPNFLYSSDVQEIEASSQYLMDSVDGVLAISTTVGLQSLIWKKKLFAIGETQLKVAADYCFQPDLSDLKKLPDLLKKPMVDKDNVLFWLLTRFYIPEDYFYDPVWLGDYLIRISKAIRSGDSSLNIFRMIDTPENVISHIIAKGRADIPVFHAITRAMADHDPNIENDLQKSQAVIEKMKMISAWRSMVHRQYGERIIFSNGNNRLLLIRGWSSSENWGVWSDSLISDILVSLPANPGQDIILQAKVRAFVHEKHPNLMVDVSVNNEKIESWKFGMNMQSLECQMIIPFRVFNQSPPVTHLRFIYHSPISPASLGISTDSRSLALGLESLLFDIYDPLHRDP